MMRIYRFSICSVLLLSLTAMIPPAQSADDPAAVARWRPHDFTFAATESPTNPFLTTFSARVQGPGGIAWTIPGFHDGQGVWKVRVAPTAPGEWSLVTKSELKELDGQTAKFTCIDNPNPLVHGPLRVDRTHPRHFLLEDGTRFYPLGYEYDWLWALDMGRPGIPTVEKTLDLIARHGFNYVILNSFAHDTAWRKGDTGPDDFGPPPLHPWAGTNDKPDHTRMNLDYWRHYDRVMSALADRGIQAHMFIKVYNKQVNWPARGSDAERLFFRWLVARYAAYPNLIWDFSKEAHNEKDLTYKQGVLKWLRDNDPYRHLITVHDDDRANDAGAYDTLTDFRTDQQHGKFHETITRQRARRAWPIMNAEFGYEHGPGGLDDRTYGKVQPPEEVVRRAWEIQMAGGYTAYYYTYTAWDVIRPLDAPPGYAYFRLLADFWRATEYEKLEPADDLVSEGWCRAQPGREYVVFQNQARPFTLRIQDARGPLQAEWFHPHTGHRTPAGTLENGTARLTPPATWDDAPLVLHVKTPTR